MTDNCEICKGAKGGVPGNENRIFSGLCSSDDTDYIVMCDYCTNQFGLKSAPVPYCHWAQQLQTLVDSDMYTKRELIAICQMSDQLAVSPTRVIVMALRVYQVQLAMRDKGFETAWIDRKEGTIYTKINKVLGLPSKYKGA